MTTSKAPAAKLSISKARESKPKTERKETTSKACAAKPKPEPEDIDTESAHSSDCDCSDSDDSTLQTPGQTLKTPCNIPETFCGTSCPSSHPWNVRQALKFDLTIIANSSAN